MLDPSIYSLTIRRTARGAELHEARPSSGDKAAYAIVSGQDGVLRLLDGITSVDLAVIKLPIGSSKFRSVELLNPTSEVTIESVGFAVWEQEFTYETTKFAWKRGLSLGGGSERSYKLSIVRRPDPDILAASYEAATDSAAGVLQIADYNIQRLDPAIEDRRGLEIVIISSLWSFLSGATTGRAGSTSSAVPGSVSPATPDGKLSPAATPDAEMRALELDAGPPVGPNEVLVTTLPMSTMIEHCLQLLADRQTVYIKLIARTSRTVPIAVALASEVKRARQLKTGEELRQYILDTEQLKRANSTVPRIDLTPDAAKKRLSTVAPASLEILLSRVVLPEFEPAPRPRPHGPAGPPLPDKAPLGSKPPAQTSWWKR